MNLKWLGHSCFLLEESTGTTVVADPYSERIGFKMPTVYAKVVTLSHDHDDHNLVENVDGQPKVINTLGFWEVDGVDVSSVLSYHDNVQGKKRGENLIFKYRMDGIEICHMGDIAEECTVHLAESLGSIDVLLLPVGGVYTIDARQAKEYVDFLMPSYVIPMHFKSPSCDLDIDKLDEFLDLFDDNQIVYINDNSITLDRSSFESDGETKIIVFNQNEF